MKLCIAGSRTLTDYSVLLYAMCRCEWDPTEIVSGGAVGVDKMGERWALENGLPVTIMRPHYGLFPNGRDAPLERNTRMAEYADAGIVIHDPESPTSGCLDFKRKMEERGKPVLYLQAKGSGRRPSYMRPNTDFDGGVVIEYAGPRRVIS